MNTHEILANSLLQSILRVGGEASAVLADTATAIRQREIPPDYLDAIGQSVYTKHNWPMEQVAAYLGIHSNLCGGTYARVVIEVGHTPGTDEDRHGNAAKLSDLPGPFVAKVDMDQGTDASGDGFLTWTEPITMERSTGVPFQGERGLHPTMVPFEFPAKTVPLEIGDSLASRTLFHLDRGQGVARWPYGSDFITLFVRADKFKNHPMRGIGL